MKMRQEKKKGFTLIELMVVVAIIGVLASVAIPSFLRFLNKAKVSEVYVNTKAIRQGAVAWFNEPHTDNTGDPMARHFPNTDSPWTTTSAYSQKTEPDGAPCTSPSSRGARFVKNTGWWQTEPWLSLKFSINKSWYYVYRFESQYSETSSVFTITAFGDLDCDSNYSIHSIIGSVSSSGEVEISGMIVTDALE